MALGTDFYLDIFGGRTGVDNIPAGTSDGDLMVFRVYFSFHTGAILTYFGEEKGQEETGDRFQRRSISALGRSAK